MYNQKQKSNVHLRKKHKTADRKGMMGMDGWKLWSSKYDDDDDDDDDDDHANARIERLALHRGVLF